MPATLALSDEIVDYFPEREGILQCKRRGEIDPFLKIVPVETRRPGGSREQGLLDVYFRGCRQTDGH